jgi:glycosyltransferase involved in cell wall biosynthesis
VSTTERQDAPRVIAPTPRAPIEPLSEPPRFSIVIPAYQAAETIGHAVDSALTQVHPAHEVIVVDDGSTDDIQGALRRFAGRITMIRKENGGAASARNAGAAAASGEFIATLDADDAFHPRRLEALAELACARPDLDLITTDTRFVVAGEPVGTFEAYNPFAVGDQRTAILRSCFVGGWPAVRLSRLREIGGFDEGLRIGHDWDCWLRLILDGSQAGLVTAPYYDYVLHAGALTSSRVSSLWDRVRLLEKAATNAALLPSERPLLVRSIRAHRIRAAETEVRAALFDTRSGSRLGRLALRRGIGTRTTMLAALGLIAPPLARRLVVPDEPPEERFTSS